MDDGCNDGWTMDALMDGYDTGNVPKPCALMRDAMGGGSAMDVRSGKRSQAMDTDEACDGRGGGMDVR
eukprot:817692-Alexandrium_andersonii.AAC.1